MIAVSVFVVIFIVTWFTPTLLLRKSARVFNDAFEDVFMTALELERIGHQVRDLSVYETDVLPRLWLRKIPFLLGIAAIIFGWVFDWNRGVLVACAALYLGLRGAFTFLGFAAVGQSAKIEQSGFAGWFFYWCGVLLKVVLCAIGIAVIFAGMDAISTVWHPGIWLVLMGFAILRFAHVPGRFLEKYGRRFSLPRFAEATEEKSVLLLRSFVDDDIRIRNPLPPQGISGGVFPDGYVRFEEALVTILKFTYDQVLAIGRPGEKLPELGALRTYWPDDEWQDAVRLTAHRCSAIILLAGATDGLSWELEHLRRWGLLGKTLVILPPDNDDLRSRERFRITVQRLAPDIIFREGLFNPQVWTGMRVLSDDEIIHYLSDRQDWVGYFYTVVSLVEEMVGRMAPRPRLENTLVLKNVVGRLALETDAPRGESVVAPLENSGHGGGRKSAKRYSLRDTEISRSGRSFWRLLRLQRGVFWFVAHDSPERALKMLDSCLDSIDSTRFPGMKATGMFVRTLSNLALEQISVERAYAEVEEAFLLAGEASRVTLCFMEYLSPPELQMRIVQGAWDLYREDFETEGESLLQSRMEGLLRKANEVADRAGDLEALGENNVRMSICLRLGGHLKKARMSAIEAAQIAGRIGNVDIRFDALAALGAIEILERCYRQGIELFSRAKRLAEEMGDRDRVKWVEKRISWVRAEMAKRERDRRESHVGAPGVSGLELEELVACDAKLVEQAEGYLRGEERTRDEGAPSLTFPTAFGGIGGLSAGFQAKLWTETGWRRPQFQDSADLMVPVGTPGGGKGQQFFPSFDGGDLPILLAGEFILKRFSCRRASHSGRVIHDYEDPEESVAGCKISCGPIRGWLTNRRIIWRTCEGVGDGIVGHVWLPWIARIWRRNRVGVARNPAIRIEIMEPVPGGDGDVVHQLEFQFARQFVPAELAANFVEAVASMYLSQGGLSSSLWDMVRGMPDQPWLRHPIETEFVGLRVPVFVRYPEGSGLSGCAGIWCLTPKMGEEREG